MKINEKNLCYLATSPPVDREGWLQKRGEVNKSWQRRYFVLKGNLLFYFEKKGDKEPLGVIILEGCTIELAQEGEQYCFQIVFHGINNRTYFLSAESQEIMERWMKALTCAGYEYMKVMVAELQRQLDEIEVCKDAAKMAAASAPKPPPRRQNPFNRPAPPPPNYGFPATNSPQSKDSPASNGGGIGTKSSSASLSPAQSFATLSATNNLNVVATSAIISSTSTTNKTNHTDEFTFQMVHEAFGREIMNDLNERKRIKELSQRPLIEL